MAIKGGAARLLMMSAYFLAFCCSIIITGAFAWFTAHETRSRNVGTLIMGIGSLLWSFTSFLLICCTAGISFFAIGRIVTDTLFMAVMVAIAILNRSATRGCSGSHYPRVGADGSGWTGCRLFVAAFTVAVIGAVLYGCSALVQMMIWTREKGKGRQARKGMVWEDA